MSRRWGGQAVGFFCETLKGLGLEGTVAFHPSMQGPLHARLVEAVVRLAATNPNAAAVCRGAWTRVTIEQFRHLALRNFYGHMAFTNILPTGRRPGGGGGGGSGGAAGDAGAGADARDGRAADGGAEARGEGLPWGVGARHCWPT